MNRDLAFRLIVSFGTVALLTWHDYRRHRTHWKAFCVLNFLVVILLNWFFIFVEQ
jgi:predicted alpha/beta hydrolase